MQPEPAPSGTYMFTLMKILLGDKNLMLDTNYIWVDKEGTKWQQCSIWEGCEFVSTDDPNYFCLHKTEYVGIKRNGVQVKLCKGHFDELKNAHLNHLK